MPFAPLVECPADYATEPLLQDGAFRSSILSKLTAAGGAVCDAFGGSAQDIEGVYAGGKFYVVQARPQVLTPPAAGR